MIRLLVQAGASMLEPISLAGWIVGGLVARRSVWAGFGIVLGWSIAMEALVTALHPGYPFGYLLPARLLAGAIVCGAVAALAWAISRWRADPKAGQS
jgi:hypothetical protein